jgi:hypothetical protein
VPFVLARGERAPRPKASGLYTRVERDAIKASGVLVLLVFERGQVVLSAAQHEGDEILW